MLESAVQSHTRLELARMGAIVQRNNVGVAETDGRPVRFGLMNDSKQLNQQFKSSDLINIIPVLIQPHHVGRVLGVYAAIECKHSDWHMTPGDARAQAQLRYIQLVQSVGGIGGFVTDPAQVHGLVRL
jgi:hypothetical protein